MKFRVKQTYDGNFIVQYKKFLFWTTIRRAWVSAHFWPSYTDETFTDFNAAVSFCKRMDELNLKLYIEKQKVLVKQAIRVHEDYLRSRPIVKTNLSFTYDSSKDKK